MENLDIKVLEVIEKSKPAQLGEVRTWGRKRVHQNSERLET